MKKFIPVFFLYFFINQASAQCTWEAVGNNDTSLLTRHQGNYASVVVDKFDSIYSVYSDVNLGNKLTVKKYVNGAWKTLGVEGFTSGATSFNSLEVSATGVPYVAFVDAAHGAKASVMKFNGSAWITVGTSGFSDSIVSNTTLSLDSAGTPYIAYKDKAHGDKANVKYFNGSTWLNLGPAGFTADTALTPYLKINKSGVPYVLFQDMAHSDKASMMFYNGSAWTYLGAPGFTSVAASQTSFDFDSTGIPYVAFGDASVGKASVMKYSGNSWVQLASNGIPTSTNPNYLRIAVDKAGVPYLAYSANYYSTYALKFTGSAWVYAYSFFGNGPSSTNTSIAITSAGAVILGYLDSWNFWTPTVLEWTQNDWASLSHPGFIPTGAGGQHSYNQNLLAVDNSGTPYFVNTASGSVLKYTGGNWVYVGNKGAVGAERMVSLCFDQQNNPCVAFKDYSGHTFVRKFDGVSWIDISPPISFSGWWTAETSLTIDATGSLLVLASGPVFTGYYSSYILKFNGFSWDTLGVPVRNSIIKIGFTPLGEPMILQSIQITQSDSTRFYVKKFNGTSWVAVGSAGTVPVGVSILNTLKATITKLGTAYVLYSANSGAWGVMKFDGSSWSNAWPASYNFGSGFGIVFPSIVSDSSNTAYLGGDSYFGGSTMALVYKYTGSNWVSVGTGNIISDFSPQQGTLLAIDPTTNLPYVSFGQFCPFVKKLVCAGINGAETYSSLNDITLYPNPSSSVFTLRSESLKINNIRIFNLVGEELEKKTVGKNEVTLNLLNLLPGIYLVEVMTDKERIIKKLVKE